MKKHSTLEDRKKIVKQSSQFTEDFAKQCRDSGETESNLGIKLFSRSKSYGDNYDTIDWSK